ncbi:FKBP-type peptidyl-prolyl cis-trans isomerase [Providencia alcalifaciens]|uniref:FKBP-type peptidyl-prolyl cis-trans isomerase n=1 Tax=Providencia alcalifaciens TaxID=126385 RepID=UPI001CC68CB6|nr:FKBP-type peptidyl-prolyl cis-trans isomerase [Providencia alcalifaciens]CAG9410465.1 FKBP-type 16 kDa peptidyl-prolyl cis-trans isomerase [Providencia alcalifaciens]CAG9410469.1 FKBP-type 16 kDa peptidyl-prolyl cis-trans isomerase [Providencia alcalifaciens]CAG9410680.1 FKBP-type 16 kDa peptidyl-prolyl cis-trans isomerase [Providencia alcalifaciens]CAG9411657.1 FKBP-type 16 kDa peptidyl-prolyl cis-trans isomerase [Providencia alcalifaciens]CAG9411811.1 FKBP-type 16 kDa peptidyl-prolyl cis-
MSTQIQAQSSVLLNFTLKLEDGSTADSSQAQGKPALFALGNGSLSPELEAQLIGLSEGEKKTFSLAGDTIFGKHNPDLVQYFSLRDFMETGTPEIGTIMLFTAMNGSEMPGVVKAIEGESITVDFNHPLAEQQITFEIEVLEIDPQLESHHANING